MPETINRLLKVEEVAQILGVSVKRAYELVRLGLLPGVVYVGRQIRVESSALDAWIAGGGKRLPGGWRRSPSTQAMV